MAAENGAVLLFRGRRFSVKGRAAPAEALQRAIFFCAVSANQKDRMESLSHLACHARPVTPFRMG
jgi:hypothetical protein